MQSSYSVTARIAGVQLYSEIQIPGMRKWSMMKVNHQNDLRYSRQTVRTGRGTRQFYDQAFGEEVLRREGPFLDVGAGDSPFGHERPDVVRVDPAYAYERPAGGKAVAALGQALPFRDRTFSVVLGSFVAQHVRDVEELVAELLRVVQPAGAVALHPVWRPSTGRHAVSVLSPHAYLFAGTRTRPADTDDSMGIYRRRLWTLPTLILRRPLHEAPRELAHTARAIARSRILVPPVVVTVPAHWGMRALVRARGTTRITLPSSWRARP
ncbi:methyltransferase domain-containing protein [Streptomyces lunaelactis]|uniref:methyltransferase domain-containing protein n=2 Tax=Streptomyces lunaelactis TaxID=1535768 RepID=UPI0034D9752F